MPNIVSPVEYRKRYIKSVMDLFEAKKKKARILREREKAFSSVENEEREKQIGLRTQFFVVNYGDLDIYLDKVVCGSVEIMFGEESVDFLISREKVRVVTGYYKNGAQKTHLEDYYFLTIFGDEKQIKVNTGTNKEFAQIIVNKIKEVMDVGVSKKKELELQIKKSEKRVFDAERTKNNDIVAMETEFSYDVDRKKDEIKKILENATIEQKKKIFEPARVVLLVISCLLGIVIFSRIGRKVENYIETVNQYEKNYFIAVDDDVWLDCKMDYDEKKGEFFCDGGEIAGEYYNDEDVEVLNRNSNSNLKYENGKFLIKTGKNVINSAYWAVDEMNVDSVLGHFETTSEVVTLRNNVLLADVVEKNIVIHWNFKDEDKKLMVNVYDGWKRMCENKAKQKIEDEEERQRKIEAEAKTEEEKKKENSGTTKNTTSGAQNSSKSDNSSSGGGYSKDETMIEGYCKDGTKVYGNPHAKGAANVCYGHKGWAGN